VQIITLRVMRRHAERDDYSVPEARVDRSCPRSLWEYRGRGDDVEERIVVGWSAIVVITLRVMSRHAERDANRTFEPRSQSFLLACTPVEVHDAERIDLGLADRADHHASRDETSREA
jgi:hypothetical protein